MARIINHFDPTQDRREFLTRGLAGALALAGLGRKGTVLAASNSPVLTPGVTEGPYWVEELLQRSDVRVDPTTGIVQPGLPLLLSITVSQLHSNGSISPLSGAVVDIWQCNALGIYSDEQIEGTSGEKFLRGLQVTNEYGTVIFHTIYPGWYSGRTVHIHLRVRVLDPATKAVTYNFVTQMFFNDTVTNQVFASTYPYRLRPNRDTTNATDGIFTGASSDNEVAANSGNYLMLRQWSDLSQRLASFNVLMDLSDSGYNNPTGGFTAGGGPAGGGPPGGTPPGGAPPSGASANSRSIKSSVKSSSKTPLSRRTR
jgi:protocatechuate 3,4-dioxygenase beta subunit